VKCARGRRKPSAPAARRATHVLLVVENVALGIDIRVRKQVRDLLTAGYCVSVITRSARENDEYRLLPGLTVLEYPSPPEPRSLPGYVREYAMSFAWAAVHSGIARLRSRIDVLQLCQPPDIYFPLARLHKLLGAAIVVDQRDLMPELFAMRQNRGLRGVTVVLRWLERRTQRIADETICVNDYLRERLIDAGATPDRVTIVRNGPVLARVQRAVPDESLRRDRSFLCCWAGKMGRQDRLDLVLGVIHHVVYELRARDITFVILGDGECLAEARALSSQLGLDPWVSFTGWVPESAVFSCFATADLGIDASLQEEVSPVKVMEYMAFGVPFVSFDLQETRRVGAGAGALVAPGDVSALARELVAVLGDPERRAEMARIGRERVSHDLAWEHQATRYLEVVDRLGNVRPARSRRGWSTGAGRRVIRYRCEWNRGQRSVWDRWVVQSRH
jgi:glycosyltransferase involved in cell wall biosynthesis